MEIIFEHMFLANNGTDRELVFTDQEEAEYYFMQSVLSIGALAVSEFDKLSFYAHALKIVEAESLDDRYTMVPVEKIVVYAPSHIIYYYARIVRLTEALFHAQIWRGERTTYSITREDGVNIDRNSFAAEAIHLIQDNRLLHYTEDHLFDYFEKKLFLPINAR